jgi:hypothetical protein
MNDQSLDFFIRFYEAETKTHPDIARNMQVLYPSKDFIALNPNQQANFRALQEREREQEMQEIMQESSLGWWGLFADGEYISSYYTPTILYAVGVNEVRQGKTVLLAKYGCQEFVKVSKVVPHYN